MGFVARVRIRVADRGDVRTSTTSSLEWATPSLRGAKASMQCIATPARRQGSSPGHPMQVHYCAVLQGLAEVNDVRLVLVKRTAGRGCIIDLSRAPPQSPSHRV
jgi:hypothetical protein